MMHRNSDDIIQASGQSITMLLLVNQLNYGYYIYGTMNHWEAGINFEKVSPEWRRYTYNIIVFSSNSKTHWIILIGACD